MTNPFAPSSREFSWIDSSLQEPMIAAAESSFEPKDVSNACEECCGQYFIACTSWMLVFPLQYVGLVLYVALATVYVLLVSDVIDVARVSFWAADADQNQAIYLAAQLLSGLTTYAAVACLPTLLRDWLRLVKSKVAGVVDGQEWSGGVTPSSHIFDYVSWTHRFMILIIYIASCLLALHNQVYQIVRYGIHNQSSSSSSSSHELSFMEALRLNMSMGVPVLLALLAKIWQYSTQRKVRMEGRGPKNQGSTGDAGEENRTNTIALDTTQ